MDTHRLRIGSTRRVAALFAVAALGLTACGGGSDTSSDTTPPTSAPATDDSRDSSDDTPQKDPDSDEGPAAVLILQQEADVPSGYRELDGTCVENYLASVADGDLADADGTNEDAADEDSTDQDAADEDNTGVDESEYTTWITYAVPEEWATVGRGSAGSGGVLGSNEYRIFRDPNGNEIRVSVDWDRRDMEGRLTDSSGEPWESFDYERTGDDGTKTITYEQVATVDVDGQKTELFYLDPSQDPDWISPTYKARVEAFELPSRASDGWELVTNSFVATFETSEEADLTQETVEQIVATFMVPECTWDRVLVDHEIMVGYDLNGDGEILDAQEMARQLQEKALADIESLRD